MFFLCRNICQRDLGEKIKAEPTSFEGEFEFAVKLNNLARDSDPYYKGTVGLSPTKQNTPNIFFFFFFFFCFVCFCFVCFCFVCFVCFFLLYFVVISELSLDDRIVKKKKFLVSRGFYGLNWNDLNVPRKICFRCQLTGLCKALTIVPV